MSTSAPVIALESVSKRYGSASIIHDLSFAVGRGEIVGFLGPNGAGKTTTMRMIAGFTAATSGRVTVAGYDMATQNVEAARRIGYLPERPPLYDALGVSAYLRFVARVKGVARTAIPTELERVTTACRLEAVLHHEIYKLSKGYRQRLGLAQALLGSPEVLLLDEPTAGLDPGQIQETREVIRAFGANHTVLLSTHILAEATLRDTLLAVDGVRAVDLRAEAGEPGVLTVDCQVDGRDGVEATIARAVAGRFDLHRLERSQPTLENIFLRYVQDSPASGEAA